MSYEFKLPDIGEGMYEAEILQWFKQAGDLVEENEILLEVQTDKSSVEITSPVSGRIEKVGGEEGDTITVGETLVLYSQANQSEESHSEITEDAEESKNKQLSPVSEETPKVENKTHPRKLLAAPSVRKAALNAEVDLAKVVASGPNGRITKKDLEEYMDKESMNKETQSKESVFEKQIFNQESDESVPIRGLRKVIFKNMQKAVSNAVLCSAMDEIEVTKLVEIKNEVNEYFESADVKLTYLPFIIKAVSIALEKNPVFNASVDEGMMHIVYKKNIHIGVAMATKVGLIVPVIQDANRKSIFELARELQLLVQKAQNNKLEPNELKGSTFTISSTGKNGGTFATPIINYPEVGILGIHKIQKQPVVLQDEIAIGNVLGVSLTFDHRIIDGEPAGQFLKDVGEVLNNPNLLLINS